MQWLVQISHKMDDPFKRFQPVARRSFFIAQYSLKTFNTVYHAVVMIGKRILVFVLGTEAVTLFRKSGCILWYIDKVPVVAFVALFSHCVSPACDGRQRVSAQQKLQILFRRRRETSRGDISNNGVALGPPGQKLSGNEGYQ